MKELAQILTIIISIVLISCSTDSNNEDDMNDPTDPTPDTIVLLKKAIKENSNGVEGYSTDYIYNGNKLVGINESDGFNLTYTYSNDLLVREDAAYAGGATESYTIFEYDANSVLAQYTIYFTEGSNTATRNVITYLSNSEISTKLYTGDHTVQDVYYYETIDTYSNGNWVERRFVEDGTVTTHAYDTKNGILKNIHQAVVFQLIGQPGEGSTNNPTHIYDQEIQIDYVYNANDYPVSSVNYDEGTGDPVFSTQFFYE